MQLFDAEGPRLHCTEEERCAFVAAVANAPREVRTFCGTLHATGCRISEALALTTGQTRVIFNPHRLTHSGTGY